MFTQTPFFESDPFWWAISLWINPLQILTKQLKKNMSDIFFYNNLPEPKLPSDKNTENGQLDDI